MAAEAPPAQLGAARDAGLSHTAFGERGLAVEVAAVEARRQTSLERFASLPAPWRLSDFDFDAQPGVDRKLIDELATLRFGDDATNVLLIAPTRSRQDHAHCGPGTGSDRGRLPHLPHHRRPARGALPPRRAGGTVATTMRFYAGLRLLITDEVGCLPLAGDAAVALFQVITRRYGKARSR